MPLNQTILVIFVSVLGCWSLISILIFFIFHPSTEKSIAGIKLQGFLQAKTGFLIRLAAENFKTFLIRDQGLQSSGPGRKALDRFRPDLETQIDLFLADKLKVAFPLLHPMMGEKTLQKFKDVFLEEVEQVLPALIDKNAAGLFSGGELEKYLLTFFNNHPGNKWSGLLKKQFQKEIRLAKILAAFAGLLIGLVQVFILILMNEAGK